MNRKLICLLTLLWTAVGGVKAQDIFVTEVTPNTEYTFTMPAQDVEVTTALYYRLKEGADNTAIYTELGSTSPVDVFLERLLVAGEWNTIALPFDIAEADMETVFGTGFKLKRLNGADMEGDNVMLHFEDATSIEAGKPYLIMVDAAVDLSAVGKEFEGVTLNTKTTSVINFDAVEFIPTLNPTVMCTKSDKLENYFFLGTGQKLYHPSSVPARIKAFRAYFKLIGSAEKARTIYLDLGDKSTSICELQYGGGLTVSHSTYDLSGRVVSGKLNKGVYIRDGRKMVIK